MIADISQLINANVKPGPYDILEPHQLFLPRLPESAPVFIDSVSTNRTGYLVLDRLVDRRNQSKGPRRFLLGRSAEIRRRLGERVAERRCRLMHRIERQSRPQNSTAWLKMEPYDDLPQPRDPDEVVGRAGPALRWARYFGVSAQRPLRPSRAARSAKS